MSLVLADLLDPEYWLKGSLVEVGLAKKEQRAKMKQLTCGLNQPQGREELLALLQCGLVTTIRAEFAAHQDSYDPDVHYQAGRLLLVISGQELRQFQLSGGQPDDPDADPVLTQDQFEWEYVTSLGHSYMTGLVKGADEIVAPLIELQADAATTITIEYDEAAADQLVIVIRNLLGGGAGGH